jgi:hypothetical protein
MTELSSEQRLTAILTEAGRNHGGEVNLDCCDCRAELAKVVDKAITSAAEEARQQERQRCIRIANKHAEMLAGRRNWHGELAAKNVATAIQDEVEG